MMTPEQIRQLCFEYFQAGVDAESSGDFGGVPVESAFAAHWERDEPKVGKPDGRTGAVIVLTDGDESGAVTCRIEFFPPANTDSGTPAQLHALDVMQRSVELAETSTEPMARVRRPRRKR